MNRYLLIVFLFALSCQAQVLQKNTEQEDKEYFSKILEMYGESTFQLPYDIQFNIDTLKKISFGKDSLDLLNVLFTLFPAPINEDCLNFNDDYNIAYWRCSKCKPQIFPKTNYYEEDFMENDTLPYDFNYTVITRHIYYVDKKGVASCLVSFSTSDDFPPCGRLSDGLLSLALLKKETEWKLVAFNPFADYQGQFSTADPASSVIILPKKDELFVVEGGFANGVPYEDYTPIGGNLYLYESQSCTQILKILNTYCYNNGIDWGSKWDTDITVSDTQSDTAIITITTLGTIDKEKVWYVPL